MKRKNAPVVGILLLLTLFASCTVRNAIHAQWDIPVVKTFNPSKTTLAGGTHCAHDERIVLTSHPQTGEELSVDFIPFLFDFKQSTPGEAGVLSLSASDEWSNSYKVPIYILYKKMKFWV